MEGAERHCSSSAAPNAPQGDGEVSRGGGEEADALVRRGAKLVREGAGVAEEAAVRQRADAGGDAPRDGGSEKLGLHEIK